MKQQGREHPAWPPVGRKLPELAPAGASPIGLEQGHESWEILPAPTGLSGLAHCGMEGGTLGLSCQ